MNYGKILMLVIVLIPLLIGTAIAAELSVTKTGSGDGVVMGEDIWCGDECSWEYGEKTVVHLKAVPYPDSTFAGWLVNEQSCEGVITIEEDTLITARFEQKVPPDEQIQTLYTYVQDTWKTFEALVDPSSGLPADNITADGVKSKYTSPTNIGAYIWSTIVARDLHIISPETARGLIAQTLTTLSTLEKHQESGQFYNWYDPETGEKLLIWPPSGDPIDPFLSSVDNGWLAVALIMVTNSIPQLQEQAQAIFDDMDFKFYYDPDAGLLRGGYWPDGTSQCNINGFTCHHYGTLNTEPRIASYIGIALHGIPSEHYFKMWRTFPDSCDWSWPEMQPGGEIRTYLGVDVFEGHYTYRGMKIVPSWGGSMFEALMVPLFVPEEDWGPKSWGINHPLYVNAQIQHGLEEALYGYWGFSPSNNPSGGYREYGVDAIGMNTDGYASNNDNTFVDYGFGDCPGREPKPLPTPDEYTNGVVTPHASFLALDFAQDAALSNLAKLRQNFDVYGDNGFYDAVNIATGEVAKYYLALDQGMVMAALGNALRHNHLQHYFTKGTIKEKIQPLLEMEEFTAEYPEKDFLDKTSDDM